MVIGPAVRVPALLLASRRRRLVAAWAVLSFGLLIRAVAGGVLPDNRGGEPTVVPRIVDINRARVPELATLPGIGPVRAEAIVLHRVRHGTFATLAELQRVDGIGPDTVMRLRPYVHVAIDRGTVR
jgi:competence ComEA-like helix-hairpin-helix protein